MSSCSPQLPIICLSDQTLIKPGSSKWVKVRSDVRKALEDYGCFEAQCDQVSMLQESFLEAMEEIFALPTEIKQRNVLPKPFRGYLIHNDLHESLGIQDTHILEKAHDFTRLLWPESEGNKSISKTIQLISEKLTELDAMVRRLVMESYGLEKYIFEHLTSTYYRLRVMKYIAPPDDNDDGASVGVNDNVSADVDPKTNVNGDIDAEANGDATAYAVGGGNGDSSVGAKDGINVMLMLMLYIGDANVGASDVINANVDAVSVLMLTIMLMSIAGVDDDDDADTNIGFTVSDGVEGNVDAEKAKLGLPGHTDKNLLGIIYQYDQIEGLEVKTKEGEWIRVKPAPDSVIVIAGYVLCALMNGRITAAYHRVRVTEKKKTRYSASLFSNPKAGYIIDSPKELVDEKHPRLFKPFDFVDFVNFLNTETGRRAQSPLHAFCAVSGK